MRDRPAPAMAAVIGDEAGAQAAVGNRLKRRIEAGADREPGLVEPLLAIAREELAANLLGEIGGGDQLCLLAAPRHDRRGDGRGFLLDGDIAVLAHAAENPVAAHLGGFGEALRIVVVRALRQAAEIGRLLDGQLVKRLVEVVDRCGGDAVSAAAEIDLIEIELEDAVLRQRLLDAQRQQRLLDLAIERDLARQQEVLGDLLGDRRCADRAAVRADALEIGERGTHDRGQVDPGMGVEVLVLGGEKGVDDARRDRGKRHEDAPLAGILGEKPSVAGMDARDDRRFVIRKLLIVGQIAAEMPVGKPGQPSAEHGENHPHHDQEFDDLHDRCRRLNVPSPANRGSRRL